MNKNAKLYNKGCVIESILIKLSLFNTQFEQWLVDNFISQHLKVIC